jgi:hypothetical protein
LNVCLDESDEVVNEMEAISTCTSPRDRCCQEMVLTKLCDHKYRYSDLYRIIILPNYQYNYHCFRNYDSLNPNRCITPHLGELTEPSALPMYSIQGIINVYRSERI